MTSLTRPPSSSTSPAHSAGRSSLTVLIALSSSRRRLARLIDSTDLNSWRRIILRSCAFPAPSLFLCPPSMLRPHVSAMALPRRIIILTLHPFLFLPPLTAVGLGLLVL